MTYNREKITTKNWFYAKVNKIYKALTRFNKGKKHKLTVSEIKEKVHHYRFYIHERIIRKECGQFNANNFDILDYVFSIGVIMTSKLARIGSWRSKKILLSLCIKHMYNQCIKRI